MEQGWVWLDGGINLEGSDKLEQVGLGQVVVWTMVHCIEGKDVHGPKLVS